MAGRKGGAGPKAGLVMLALGLAASVGASSCPWRLVRMKAPAAVRATPPAPFSSIDTANRSAILAYVDSLHFDTSYGMGETRRLMMGVCPGRCSYGPLVRFQPETGTVALDRDALRHGRILARLINLSTATGDSYPKLNLRPGDTVYWWVDSVPSGWRSLYIPRDPGRAISPPDTFITEAGNLSYGWSRSFAKYIWRDNDEALWVPCLNGCCKSSSGGP